MTYGMLLTPHANARYEQAARPLAQAELTLLLGACGLDGETFFHAINGVEFLCFRADGLSVEAAKILSEHSLLYFLAEMKDGTVAPIFSRAETYLHRDLPSILKYKGKTNEAFTHLLLNLALCAGELFGGADLRVLDPMCGRGTTLFDAVNRGFSATGVDADRTDIQEAGKFFERYLKYHHFKHAARDFSMTVPGGKNVSRRQFEFARDAQDYKEKKTLSLSLICAGAESALKAYKDESFHVVCADLPYGVKHAPMEGGGVSAFHALLAALLPLMHKKLRRGGAVALSFNSYTLRRDDLRDKLKDAGFAVLTGGAYDGLEHWVEQAVLRDAAVAVKV
jgi:SAM-dependent methyltransferase